MLQLRNWLRACIAGVIARTPSIRGRGRVVLLLDRLLTDSSDPSSYTVTTTVNDGVRMVLDLRTWDQKFAFYYRQYDLHQIEVVLRLFGEGDFWDVGGSIGLYAVTFGRLCAARGTRLVSVEPHPTNCGRLAENVRLNGLDDVVTLERAALGDSRGSLSLVLSSEGIAGNAMVSPDGTCRVEVSTLDDLWRQQGCRRIGFIKVDTEGWDAKILLGGRDVLSECRPNLLVEFNRERMAIYGIAMAPSWEFLVRDLGYHCYRFDRRGTLFAVDEPGEFENLVFLSRANGG